MTNRRARLIAWLNHPAEPVFRYLFFALFAAASFCAGYWWRGPFIRPGGREIFVYDTAGKFKIYFSLPRGTHCSEPNPLDRLRGYGDQLICDVPVTAGNFTGCEAPK